MATNARDQPALRLARQRGLVAGVRGVTLARGTRQWVHATARGRPAPSWHDTPAAAW